MLSATRSLGLRSQARSFSAFSAARFASAAPAQAGGYAAPKSDVGGPAPKPKAAASPTAAAQLPVQHVQREMKISNPRTSKKERLIILGSGWGGFTLAKRLARNQYEVTVISPTGYFAFTPLLASTSVGTLEYRVALESVRRLTGVQLVLGRARDINIEKNQITIASGVPNPAKSQWSTSAPPRALGSPFQDEAKGREGEGAAEEELFALEYDKLVVAVGAFSATFGTPGVYEHAHFLKDIRDARAIRKRILDCFERASEPFVREKEKRELVSFRIVGGGPTGVEFAAELHDLISSDMKKHYPDLAKMASITLYDVAPGILLSFEESLRRYAMNTFARDQVIVRPNSKVNRVGDGWMEIEGEGKVPFGLLVWSTGLEPNPLIKSMKGVSKDPRSSSLHTDDFLRVIGEEGRPIDNVFAIGDNAIVKDGDRLPATAQVASQKATVLADNLNALAKGRPEQPFKLRSKGSMVYLGSWRAMIDRSSPAVDGIKGTDTGYSAWFLWRSAYWGMAMSWRNRVLLLVYWFTTAISGRDISRF